MAGTPFEKHIHVDTYDKFDESEKHLQVDTSEASICRCMYLPVDASIDL